MNLFQRFMEKIRDPLLYEVGPYFVITEDKLWRVYCSAAGTTECIAVFADTVDGMTSAIAYADYAYTHGIGAEKYYRSITPNSGVPGTV